MDEKLDWIFGVVGNIVKTHSGEDGVVYYGAKAFTGGTKVYLNGKYWDSRCENIAVIGRNRFGRTVFERVPIELIENVRVQRIYKPHVLEIIDYLRWMEGLEWWERTAADRKDTERFVKEWNERNNK